MDGRPDGTDLGGGPGALQGGAAERIYDVVVIGGGPAGMAAALHLRDRDILVLERDDRLGGRLRSESRGDYWLNLGAHLLPGPGSTIRRIMDEFGLKAIDIPGNKFAIGLDGQLFKPRSVFSVPFALPLTLIERVSLVTLGMKLLRAVRRWKTASAPRQAESPAAARERAASVMSERSFRDFIGRPAGRVGTLMATAARRAAVEIDQQTVGVGISLFGSVWASGANSLAANMAGGSGRLGAAVAQALGGKLLLEAEVTDVIEGQGPVQVAYECQGSRAIVLCRQVVVATPAFVAARIVSGIPPSLRRTLENVQYGPFISMGIITGETTATPLDDVYAVTMPGAAFDMLFNHANPLRTSQRRPGGSLMAYAGGAKAKAMSELPDDDIRDRFLTDILGLVPALKDKIVETRIARWEPGNACRAPGFDFGPMMDHCARHDAKVHFAGDYFGAVGTMETAAATGVEAAARCEAALAATGADIDIRTAERLAAS